MFAGWLALVHPYVSTALAFPPCSTLPPAALCLRHTAIGPPTDNLATSVALDFLTRRKTHFGALMV